MATVEDGQEFELPTGLLTGAAILVAIGWLLTALGILLGAGATATAVRRWVAQLETPPQELARAHWHRAWNAAGAGADAWRKAAQRD